MAEWQNPHTVTNYYQYILHVQHEHSAHLYSAVVVGVPSHLTRVPEYPS